MTVAKNRASSSRPASTWPWYYARTKSRWTLSPPRLDRPCLTNADVVFDARPGSTHWKDVMVMLVGVIRDSDLEVKFVGFYDLVAARMHPASTMIDQS